MPKTKSHTAKYDKQWEKTAKNKIKRITKHGGSKEIVKKYQDNPKWKGSKKPITKGRNTKGGK